MTLVPGGLYRTRYSWSITSYKFRGQFAAHEMKPGELFLAVGTYDPFNDGANKNWLSIVLSPHTGMLLLVSSISMVQM